MPADRLYVTEMREDVSRFVVHLTRDDRGDFSNGASARKNFLAILKQQKIIGFRAHCLHASKVRLLSEKVQKGLSRCVLY